mmetsp:Transcript_152094/g.283384  ORF Transcript_152094/g.283384 Transcript_152094/m.283384 type:complete len:216 (-) Transcript_152094:6-653(-)
MIYVGWHLQAKEARLVESLPCCTVGCHRAEALARLIGNALANKREQGSILGVVPSAISAATVLLSGTYGADSGDALDVLRASVAHARSVWWSAWPHLLAWERLAASAIYRRVCCPVCCWLCRPRLELLVLREGAEGQRYAPYDSNCATTRNDSLGHKYAARVTCTHRVVNFKAPDAHGLSSAMHGPLSSCLSATPRRCSVGPGGCAAAVTGGTRL